MTGNLSKASKLFLAFTFTLVPLAAKAASPSSSLANCVSSLRQALAASRNPAYDVYKRAVAEAKKKDPNESPMTTIVRASVSKLANQKNWTQEQKADFWRDTAKLLQKEPIFGFVSSEFKGRDGAIVFQGDHKGMALVITTSGDVFRGTIEPALDPAVKPRAVWNADYSTFRQVLPGEPPKSK